MLGERIKELRVAHGLTQEELGKSIGVGKSTINKYELNKIAIPSAKVEGLAHTLGVTPAYLMGWENEKGYTSNKARLIAEIENMSEEQAALLLAAFQAAKASK